MRDHVEIDRIRRQGSIGSVMRANLHEAVADMRVVEAGQHDNLELGKVRREMPDDRTLKIGFPDVEHEAESAEHMRFREFRRPQRDMVEVTVGTWVHRPLARALPRRE